MKFASWELDYGRARSHTHHPPAPFVWSSSRIRKCFLRGSLCRVGCCVRVDWYWWRMHDVRFFVLSAFRLICVLFSPFLFHPIYLGERVFRFPSLRASRSHLIYTSFSGGFFVCRCDINVCSESFCLCTTAPRVSSATPVLWMQREISWEIEFWTRASTFIIHRIYPHSIDVCSVD